MESELRKVLGNRKVKVKGSGLFVVVQNRKTPSRIFFCITAQFYYQHWKTQKQSRGFT